MPIINELEPVNEYTESVGDYVHRMGELGYEVITPAVDQLLVDIDDQESLDRFYKIIDRIAIDYPSIRFIVTASNSGLPHAHAVVRMPWAITDVERIAWQAILGSDPIREFLSLKRVYNNESPATLLVRKVR